MNLHPNLPDWQKIFNYKGKDYLIESSFRGRFLTVHYITTENQLSINFEQKILMEYLKTEK